MNLKILFVDNRDSFAYNIIELLRQLGTEPDIITYNTGRNSTNTLIHNIISTINSHDTDNLRTHLALYDGIVLSPGAGIPDEYPIMQSILHSRTTTPILGICLGHQAIAQTGGAHLLCMPQPLHGHTSHLTPLAPRHWIFDNVNDHCDIGRYHSWVVDPKSIGASDITPIATDENGNIQAICHRSLPYIGLQFHPESIITTEGKQIIANWLENIGKNH